MLIRSLQLHGHNYASSFTQCFVCCHLHCIHSHSCEQTTIANCKDQNYAGDIIIARRHPKLASNQSSISEERKEEKEKKIKNKGGAGKKGRKPYEEDGGSLPHPMTLMSWLGDLPPMISWYRHVTKRPSGMVRHMAWQDSWGTEAAASRQVAWRVGLGGRHVNIVVKWVVVITQDPHDSLLVLINLHHLLFHPVLPHTFPAFTFQYTLIR